MFHQRMMHDVRVRHHFTSTAHAYAGRYRGAPLPTRHAQVLNVPDTGHFWGLCLLGSEAVVWESGTSDGWLVAWALYEGVQT